MSPNHEYRINRNYHKGRQRKLCIIPALLILAIIICLLPILWKAVEAETSPDAGKEHALNNTPASLPEKNQKEVRETPDIFSDYEH